MLKSCVICGALFKAAPTDRKVTCGKSSCVSENKSRTHAGKHYTWSDAARERKSAQGQNPNLKLGTRAAQRSPIAGPFETNQEAKLWWIVSPSGELYHMRNLRKFCREHPQLFMPDPWTNAYSGLKHVQLWLNGKTPRTVSKWKGWTLERMALSPEEESL
jgi:hypothetical protein